MNNTEKLASTFISQPTSNIRANMDFKGFILNTAKFQIDMTGEGNL